MLNTEDVAYLVSLVEKASSIYPRRKEIIEHLQDAWRRSSSQGGFCWRLPIAATMVGIVEVEATPRK